MNIRIVAAVSVAALLAIGFAASTKSPSLTQRIDDANADLMTHQSSIPYAQLHDRGLEILRARLVAKDDDAP